MVRFLICKQVSIYIHITRARLHQANRTIHKCVYLALVFSFLVLFFYNKNGLFYVEKHHSACKVRGLRSMHIYVESYLKHIRSI